MKPRTSAPPKPIAGQKCFRCATQATISLTDGDGVVKFACEDHARKRKSYPRPKGWRPTRGQKARILDGARSIRTDKDPKLEHGQVVELLWSRPAKLPRGEDGVLPERPRSPVTWMLIRSVTEESDGYLIKFRLIDQRLQATRLVRSSPPVFDAEIMREDARREWESGRGPSTEDVQEAREQGAYTTDPGAAIDPFEGVDDSALAEFTVEAAVKAERDQASVPLERRLEIVRAEARAQGVDLSHIDASIERRIKAAERRVRAKGKAA